MRGGADPGHLGHPGPGNDGKDRPPLARQLPQPLQCGELPRRVGCASLCPCITGDAGSRTVRIAHGTERGREIRGGDRPSRDRQVEDAIVHQQLQVMPHLHVSRSQPRLTRDDTIRTNSGDQGKNRCHQARCGESIHPLSLTDRARHAPRQRWTRCNKASMCAGAPGHAPVRTGSAREFASFLPSSTPH